MDAWIRNIMKSVGSVGSGSNSSRRRDEPEILLCKRRCASPVVAISTASSTATAASAPRAAACYASCPSGTLPSTAAPQPTTASAHRIAHWDKKREKCKNCTHIYLKTLSRHPGFCSVDCKSNAAYLDKVNRTIRAMKDAVEQRQQKIDHDTASTASTATEEEQPVVEDAPVVSAPESALVHDDNDASDDEDVCDDDRAPHAAHTFSEFGLESRILDASNVEWAFSALY